MTAIRRAKNLIRTHAPLRRRRLPNVYDPVTSLIKCNQDRQFARSTACAET